MNIKLIEDLRKRKDLTQAEFAKKIGVSTFGYQKMIQVEDIKVSTLEKICEVFSVNISTFFGNETIKSLNANVVFELESTDTLKIDMKNKRLEILKK